MSPFLLPTQSRYGFRVLVYAITFDESPLYVALSWYTLSRAALMLLIVLKDRSVIAAVSMISIEPQLCDCELDVD